MPYDGEGGAVGDGRGTAPLRFVVFNFFLLLQEKVTKRIAELRQLDRLQNRGAVRESPVKLRTRFPNRLLRSHGSLGAERLWQPRASHRVR